MPLPQPSITCQTTLESYKTWCDHHQKPASEKRFGVWQKNYQIAEAHNAKYRAGLSGYYLSVKTKNADLTNKEYRSLLLASKSRGMNNAKFTFQAEDSAKIGIPKTGVGLNKELSRPLKTRDNVVPAGPFLQLRRWKANSTEGTTGLCHLLAHRSVGK